MGEMLIIAFDSLNLGKRIVMYGNSQCQQDPEIIQPAIEIGTIGNR